MAIFFLLLVSCIVAVRAQFDIDSNENIFGDDLFSDEDFNFNARSQIQRTGPIFVGNSLEVDSREFIGFGGGNSVENSVVLNNGPQIIEWIRPNGHSPAQNTYGHSTPTKNIVAHPGIIINKFASAPNPVRYQPPITPFVGNKHTAPVHKAPATGGYGDSEVEITQAKLVAFIRGEKIAPEVKHISNRYGF